MLLGVLAVGGEATGRATKTSLFPQQLKHRDRVIVSPGELKNTDKIIDGVIKIVPKLTSIIKNVTKGANENQIKNLKKVSLFLGPAMQFFFEIMSPNSLSSEERSRLEEIGSLTSLLTSSLTKSNSQTNDPLPDYTDLLENPATTDSEADISIDESLFIKTSLTSNPFTDKNKRTQHLLASLASTSKIIERPVDVDFLASRVPRFGIKNSSDTGTEEEQTKQAEQRTLPPFKQLSGETQDYRSIIQQHSAFLTEGVQTIKKETRSQSSRRETAAVTLKPSTMRRRYPPSQFLRQRFFGYPPPLPRHT